MGAIELNRVPRGDIGSARRLRDSVPQVIGGGRATAITLVSVAVPIAMPSSLSPLVLTQHADKHRPQRPILLAVDQQFGQGASRGFARVLGCRFRRYIPGATLRSWWANSSFVRQDRAMPEPSRR